MAPTDAPTSDAPSPTAAAQRFSAVRMPIDAPVEDMDEAVERLRSCPSTELRRARKHHRRALESLQNGGYSSLSESTRTQLDRRLRENLEALNRALEPAGNHDSDEAASDAGSEPRSFSLRLRDFFRKLV